MPVNVEPRYDIADIASNLVRIYADFAGADTGDAGSLQGPDACLSAIRDALRGDGVFYTGMFNGKPVAGALVTGPADARRIHLIAVHPLNRRRGVSLRLVEEIGRLEHMTGASALEVQPRPASGDVLKQLGFTPAADGLMRKSLSAG